MTGDVLIPDTKVLGIGVCFKVLVIKAAAYSRIDRKAFTLMTGYQVRWAGDIHRNILNRISEDITGRGTPV